MRSAFVVRRVVVVPVVVSPLAPMVVDDEEPVVEEDVPALCEVDDGVLPAAVSVDGEVVLPLAVEPELVLGVAAEPVLGEVAVEPLLPVPGPAPVVPLVPAEPPVVPEAVPDCAQTSPKVPAMAAAMMVMPNLR